MDLVMGLHISFFCESLVAIWEGAVVWLLSCVRVVVDLQSRSASEFSMAHGALIWADVVVPFDVILQVPVSLEGLMAAFIVANVGLLSCVDS